MDNQLQSDAQPLTELSHGCNNNAGTASKCIDGASNTCYRQHILTQTPRLPSVDLPSAAIQNQSQNNFSNTYVQDVLPHRLNSLRSLSNSGLIQLFSTSPFTQNVFNQPSTTLESIPLPSNLAHHGPVTVPQTDCHQRLRTKLLPKLRNSKLLAAQHGIPIKLPQPPRPNINSISNNNYNINIRNNNSVAKASDISPQITTTNPSITSTINPDISIFDIQSLMTDYLNMLTSKTGQITGAASSEAAAPVSMTKDVTEASNSVASEPSANDAAESIRALFGGANDLTSSAWDEYLSSPFEFGLDNTSVTDSPFETPIDTLLATPAIEFVGASDFNASPVVADDVLADFETSALADMPLFAGLSPVITNPQITPNEQRKETEQPDFSGLYTMTMTPEISPLVSNSSSADPSFISSLSPQAPMKPVEAKDAASTSPSSVNISKKGGARTARKTPTGTRKNITPEALVPLDAPTQPRTYLAPSATSRKEVPAIFARKRNRKAAFGDEDEDVVEPATPIPETPLMTGPAYLASLGLPPDATEAEQIAAKRRQNTLAARRSRKRKLEHQKQLEDSIESLTKERDMWKKRALEMRQRMIQLGFPEPFRDTEE